MERAATRTPCGNEAASDDNAAITTVQALYLEVPWLGYVCDVIKKKTAIDQERYQIPSTGEGVLIHGRKNTEKMLKQAPLSLV